MHSVDAPQRGTDQSVPYGPNETLSRRRRISSRSDFIVTRFHPRRRISPAPADFIGPRPYGMYTFTSTLPWIPGTLPLSVYCHISTAQG